MRRSKLCPSGLAWLLACVLLAIEQGACIEAADPLPIRRFRPTSPGFDVIEAKLGPAGGTLSLLGGASVAVPQGALNDEVWLAIRARELATLARLPEGVEAISQPHSFLPVGQRFAREVSLQLAYRDTRDQTDVALLRLDDAKDTRWERVGGATTSIGVARAQVQRLGIYVVVRSSAAEDASVGE